MTDMAVLARTAGGPEVLEWTALDAPPPGPGEARVAQRAVGVNFIDTYYRAGSYPWPSTPLVPGAEAATSKSIASGSLTSRSAGTTRRVR